MNTDQRNPKVSTKKETKEKVFQFVCDDELMEILSALAKKHRASKAHVARIAVFQMAEKEAVSV